MSYEHLKHKLNNRRYIQIGYDLIEKISLDNYRIGDKLPTEREIAELYNVSRTVIREAMIMLELEGYIEVRKGSGVYLVSQPQSKSMLTECQTKLSNDIGPFEMLQGRQLLESNIAEFAASQVSKAEVLKLREILQNERHAFESGDQSYDYDQQFHIQIAITTKNTLLIQLAEYSWKKRVDSEMWAQLHHHIHSTEYRRQFLEDHEKILLALQLKQPQNAKLAMWQHLENVKQILLTLSDIEDESFDGFLFESYPIYLKDKEKPVS